MSMHRSFSGGAGLAKHRNVLSRAERIERLKKAGRWNPTQGVFNLPKVRNIKGA